MFFMIIEELTRTESAVCQRNLFRAGNEIKEKSCPDESEARLLEDFREGTVNERKEGERSRSKEILNEKLCPREAVVSIVFPRSISPVYHRSSSTSPILYFPRVHPLSHRKYFNDISNGPPVFRLQGKPCIHNIDWQTICTRINFTCREMAGNPLALSQAFSY